MTSITSQHTLLVQRTCFYFVHHSYHEIWTLYKIIHILLGIVISKHFGNDGTSLYATVHLIALINNEVRRVKIK